MKSKTVLSQGDTKFCIWRACFYATFCWTLTQLGRALTLWALFRTQALRECFHNRAFGKHQTREHITPNMFLSPGTQLSENEHHFIVRYPSFSSRLLASTKSPNI